MRASCFQKLFSLHKKDDPDHPKSSGPDALSSPPLLPEQVSQFNLPTQALPTRSMARIVLGVKRHVKLLRCIAACLLLTCVYNVLFFKEQYVIADGVVPHRPHLDNLEPGFRIQRSVLSEVFEDWLSGPLASESFIFQDLYVPSPPATCKGMIVTAGDEKIDVGHFLNKNRIQYAMYHQYCYRHLTCQRHLVKTVKSVDPVCSRPEYWKYLALQRLLKDETVEWILYADVDTMFTNVEVSIEDFIRSYSSVVADLFIGADLRCRNEKFPINTGVMLFRNSRFSQMLVYQVLMRKRYHLALNITNKWGARNLHDQPILIDVLNDMNEINSTRIQEICSGRDLRDFFTSQRPLWQGMHTIVVPGKAINAFKRGNSYFIDDLINFSNMTWSKGDWIAHFTGMFG
jgi:hypothetical protein